jgi:hypothetical protein
MMMVATPITIHRMTMTRQRKFLPSACAAYDDAVIKL